jgi:glucose-1-phosphate adenylyltransferase
MARVMRQKVFDYNVTCVIMGGGAGTRLHPLTLKRAKPAVPLGAKFRLIDIPISNCLNSGLNRIYILTQFNSTSLHRHIVMSYHFDRFSKGFVEILAAQQSPQYNVERSWYEGTADAVRKNLLRFRDTGGDEVLILSGDQIYRMDYTDVLHTHRGAAGSGGSHADVTIAGLLVSKERARSLGVMKISPEGDVLEFVEKPGKNDALFEGLEAPPELLKRFGLASSDEPLYLANMGIYVFGLEQLESALDNSYCDFGKEILPGLLGRRKVRAHVFDGYWEDIGTIRAFHQANIELASKAPRFDFYKADAPIYTRARLLPATKIERATVSSSLVSDGCLVEEAVIEDSLIGLRSIIGKGCTIRNTYVMGCDFYEAEELPDSQRGRNAPRLGIGAGTHIESAIIDKNAHVGRNVSIRNREEHRTFDDGTVVIREGIVIVPRGAVIPDGYSI